MARGCDLACTLGAGGRLTFTVGIGWGDGLRGIHGERYLRFLGDRLRLRCFLRAVGWTKHGFLAAGDNARMV